MRKKYRIKTLTGELLYPVYCVQVRKLFRWVTVKHFFDPYDPDFAQREAEELLDKLNEK